MRQVVVGGLSIVSLLCSSAGIAQGVDSSDIITISEGPSFDNSYRENSLSGICDGKFFEIRLRSQGMGNVSLIGITRNGNEAPEAQTRRLQELLEKSGSAKLSSLRCQGEDQIVLGISGSLIKPFANEDDDYIRFFTITFPHENKARNKR